MIYLEQLSNLSTSLFMNSSISLHSLYHMRRHNSLWYTRSCLIWLKLYYLLQSGLYFILQTCWIISCSPVNSTLSEQYFMRLLLSGMFSLSYSSKHNLQNFHEGSFFPKLFGRSLYTENLCSQEPLCTSVYLTHYIVIMCLYQMCPFPELKILRIRVSLSPQSSF